MISKISYIKLIREDIRHRGWLAALSGVLLFLSMPVYTLIYLDSYSEDPEVLKEFADTFSGFINGYNSAFLIILIGILAFAVGILISTLNTGGVNLNARAFPADSEG